MSENITGIYVKKNGKARIKVHMYTESGTVYYHKRWGGDWAKSFDTMPMSSLIANWKKETKEELKMPDREQFGDNCTCFSPCGGCGTDVQEEVTPIKSMTLAEVLSCIPNDIKFVMSVEQLISRDTDFDVTMTESGNNWVILKAGKPFVVSL